MRVAHIVGLAAVLLIGSGSDASADTTIRIWKVGSPHRGDTPAAHAPTRLEAEAAALGLSLAVEAFPAMGFAATFRDAIARNAAPDVLSFDNFGVMVGITTPLGTFEGISDRTTVQGDFVRVTGTFDGLLGPERGWNFLVRASINHSAARALAAKGTACPTHRGRPLSSGLEDVVPRLAMAYVEGSPLNLQGFVDPDRIVTQRSRPEHSTAESVQLCGWRGNDTLAFVQAGVVYEAEGALGQALVLLVLRKPSSTWQLLVASRDPITNSAFWEAVSLRLSRLSNREPTTVSPLPASLLSPEDGRFPTPPRGQRFGSFEWQSSDSADVVAEIVEFAYEDDARLFIEPVTPGSRRRLSSGQLWTTNSGWIWRVWSIGRAGDIAFTNVRMFPN